MTDRLHNAARSDLTDEELQQFFDEYEKRAEEFHKRLHTLDMKAATLTEAEQKESERMWRLFEQSKRVDAQHIFCLVQTYASILEAVATGSMGFADLELNAHYLKIVNLIRIFLASPQMKDCPVDFRPAVDHVLPGTGIDVAWDDVLLPEVHELLSKVQEYALSNAPFPNEEEGPLAIPPEVIATVCQRAIEATRRYRAEVERRFQGVVKRIEAKRLPGLNDRKAGWLVDTINSLLEFVHVHREQFLTDKELSTLDSLGTKMNRLAVALDLTTPDRPVYYGYGAELAHGIGPDIVNPTWPGAFTDVGDKSGFRVQPTAEWLKRIHALRNRARALAATEGPRKSPPASAGSVEGTDSSGAPSPSADSDGPFSLIDTTLYNLEDALTEWAKGVRARVLDDEGDEIDWGGHLRRKTESGVAEAAALLEFHKSAEYAATFKKHFDDLYTLADNYPDRLMQLDDEDKKECGRFYDRYREEVSPDVGPLNLALWRFKEPFLLRLPGWEPRTMEDFAEAIAGVAWDYRARRNRECFRLQDAARRLAQQVRTLHLALLEEEELNRTRQEAKAAEASAAGAAVTRAKRDEKAAEAPVAPQVEIAYQEYQQAEGKLKKPSGQRPTDRACYAWVKANVARSDLPGFETWSRYVRRARRNRREQKNTPRAGRQHGRSVVEAKDVDQSDLRRHVSGTLRPEDLSQKADDHEP